jgi:hypothetical protein
VPLVLIHKAKRPKWQDTKPKNPALRDAYRIADSHLKEFANAYKAVVNGVLDDTTREALVQALARGDAAAVAQVIPWYDPNDPESLKRWQKAQDKFDKTYAGIVEESGTASLARLGLEMSFTLDNPYSLSWAKDHAGELIHDLSTEGRDAVRAAVVEGFELGNPPASMARTIRESIGQTDREALAVQRRLALHLSNDMDEDLATSRAERYAGQLLNARAERIARTETITAEARGTMDSWRVARDDGLIVPGTQKKWIDASASPRTCDICLELGEMDPIDLDESWNSSIVGPVEMPPAHVSCRCSMGLVIP